MTPVQSTDVLEVNREELSVGEIIMEGAFLKDGSCYISPFRVQTTSISSSSIWLGILLDEQCRVVVNAIWEGSLESGPPDVIKPLLQFLTTETTPLQESSRSDNSITLGGSSLASPLASKTSEQHVYMYGYGGTADQLTHKRGKLTFSYNGVSATLTSESGTCQGSNHGSWSWVVDSCLRISYVPGPATTVLREGQGDYHCSPAGSFPCNLSNPDGYYHSLVDEEDGHANGISHCYFSYSGNIVAGVKRQIVQGCN